jgi:phage-related holin
MVTKYLNEIKVFLSGIALFYNINLELLKALSILMILDFIGGMLKHSLVDSLKFSMREAKKGLVTKVFILFIIFATGVTANAIGKDFSFYIDSVMKLFLINELFSLVNIYRSIKYNENYKTDDFIGILFEKASEKIKEIINKFFDK